MELVTDNPGESGAGVWKWPVGLEWVGEGYRVVVIDG